MGTIDAQNNKRIKQQITTANTKNNKTTSNQMPLNLEKILKLDLCGSCLNYKKHGKGQPRWVVEE